MRREQNEMERRLRTIDYARSCIQQAFFPHYQRFPSSSTHPKQVFAQHAKGTMGRVVATWRYNLKFSIQTHLFQESMNAQQRLAFEAKSAQEQASFDMALKMVRNSVRSIMGVGLAPLQEAKFKVYAWRAKVWAVKGFLHQLRKLGFYDDGIERHRLIQVRLEPEPNPDPMLKPACDVQAIVALRIGRSREMQMARDSGMKLKNQLARLTGEHFSEKQKQATLISNLRNELLSYRHGESSYIKKLQQQIFTLQEEQKVTPNAANSYKTSHTKGQ